MEEIKLFEQRSVRSHYDEEQEKWYFSIIDVIAVHLIVTFVAGGDVRFRDARVHIDFVYAHTFCRYQ